MADMNPTIVYYDAVLVFSILMTGVYIFKWHKHFDDHITLVFLLIPVINLGYVFLAHSTTVTEALTANKIIYLGGSFLQMIVLMVVCTLCDIHLNRYLKVLLFALSAGIYLFVLNPMNSTLFYRSVKLVERGGVPVLVKEYGVMHTVFQVMVIVYYLLSIAIIIDSLFRKNQISRKILILLILPEDVAITVFFLGKQAGGTVDLLPAVYLIAQITYLIIVSKVSIYDITDTAIDSMMQKGDTGFLSIDFGYHYLGSNETAKEVFPILREMTVDLSVLRRKSFSDLVLPWLEAYNTDESRNTVQYEKDGRYYQIKIEPLYNNRKKKGYELTITDNTQDRELNNRLQQEVDKKTEHIVEMHNRLILGMATMVESRDNSTGGHIRRTSDGVQILLSVMKRMGMPGLTDTFCKNLIKAAPMHDLGKIAVDDEVLKKPGRFTPEEYEKMKAHASEGARIVHEILKDTDDDEFHLMAENVAKYHHERWDGSGYPEGLKGEQIPREARIMAVADVYDALVSKRIYKDKMPFEKADQIMQEGMGTQFAPEMREVYLYARPKLEAYYGSLEN